MFDPSYLSTPAVSFEDENERKDLPPPQSSVPDVRPSPEPALDVEPTADDILSEMGRTEPAREPELDAAPDSAPAPAQPTGIDLSGLTDEQKALVAQLVDSMKK